jgi:hypothetical protein
MPHANQQILTMYDFKYDLEHQTESMDVAAQQVSVQYSGVNAGSTPALIGRVSWILENSQKVSYSFSTSTTISAGASITAKVPIFGEGTISLGVEHTFAHESTQSTTVTEKIGFDLGNDVIPPFSYQDFEYDASMIKVKIPFTATADAEDECGTTRKIEIDGMAEVTGVASYLRGEFTKKTGPVIPIECNDPRDVPIDTQRTTPFCSKGSPKCADNAFCKRIGKTTGICCEEGKMLPCCALAEAHPSCIEEHWKPTEVLCPSPRGTINHCCNELSSDFTAQGRYQFTMTQI